MGLPCGALAWGGMCSCRCASSSKHASLPSSSPSVAPLPPSSSSTSLGRGSIMVVALWLWYVVGGCVRERVGYVLPLSQAVARKASCAERGDGEGGEVTEKALLDLVANLPAF